jgi:predicted aspartyl protease
LSSQTAGNATLADGSVQEFDIYAAEVSWDGAWRSILVWRIGEEALLGMRLMAGHELRMAIVPGGTVEIGRLP